MTLPLSGVPGLDKREDYRARYVADVDIEANGETHRGRTSDISLGGLMLEMDPHTPLAAGSEILVRLPLLEGAPLELRCTVRQVIPGAGVGLEFVDLRPADRERIRRLLDKLPQ
jgi:c-di-GMP-binding flagellar brake protein YcgR